MKKAYTIPQTVRFEAQDIYCMQSASNVTNNNPIEGGTQQKPVIGGAPVRNTLIIK